MPVVVWSMVHKMVDKINTQYNTEKLIHLIKGRPALYDKTLLGYTDRPLKQKLWSEICELMTPGWMHHTMGEKVQIGIKVQKQWQEIKSTFQKELNLQKLGRLTGTRGIKRKKYDYFDKLRFLIPAMNLQSPSSISTQGQNVRPTAVHASQSYVSATSNCHRYAQTSGQVHKNNRRKQPNKEPYLNILNIESSKQIDEDKHFLLSLVPSLQKMSSTQKIRAKMMFLQAIHDIEDETQRTPPCPQFVGNKLGYNQPCQCAAPPAPCTITSVSDQPSLIQSSPRILSSPSPAPQQASEHHVSTVWVKDSSILLAQPPQQSLNVVKDEIIID